MISQVRCFCYIIGGLMASAAMPVIAQETTAGPEGNLGDPTEVVSDNPQDVIVVTASRREEKLQEAPAAINLISGDTIDKLHVDDVTSLTTLIPGIKIDGNSRDQLRLGLRGAFASATTPGTGQAVGLYIDGVPYLHTSNLGQGLFGIERVEVLRGPQGTLYGQNVVGGLINIITKNPGDDLEVDFKASYSSFNRVDLTGFVGGPISDTLSASASAYYTKSDGWQRNLVTGNKLDQLDMFGVRSKFVWTPTDTLTVKLIGEASTDNTFGIPRNIVFGNPNRFTVPEDRRETLLVYDGGYNSSVGTGALLVDWDMDWATLSSISSYQRNRPNVMRQAFITDPVSYQTVDRRNENDTFTQEVRLAGELPKLNWQTGIFYLNDDVLQFQEYHTFAAPGTRTNSQGIKRDNLFVQDFRVKVESFSLFAEATYDISNVISLTAGGRYNWDEKQSDLSVTGESAPFLGGLAGPPFTLAQSADWKEFTPKVTLKALWNNLGFLDTLLLYGTASKGYLSGTFISGPTKAAATGALPPQTAWNYEGGFKTTFLDRKATFNTTAYKVSYKDLQSISLAAGQVAVASTDADAWGIEVSASLNPLPGLFLSADYNYLHTKIATGATDPSGRAVGGNRLPQSPPHSYGFTGSYSTSIAQDTSLRFTGSYTYKGVVYYDVRNERTSLFPEVNELSKQKNLDAEIALLRGRFEFSVWGRNLTDNASLLRAYDFARNTDLSVAEIASGKTVIDGPITTPRQIGATVRYSF